VKINEDEDIPKFVNNTCLEPTESYLIKLHFALDKLPKEQLSKIESHLDELNKHNNPLIYNAELAGTNLSIEIKENPEFKQVKLKVPFTFEKYFNQQMFSRVRSRLVSREDIDTNIKQEMLENLDKMKATMPILKEKVNEHLKGSENLVLCHGDTNISNILVGPENKVYLIDLDFVGHNFFFSDLSFFLTVLQYKIDFKTMKFSLANDVEILKKPIYSMYKQRRPLSMSFEEFNKKLSFGTLLNSAVFGFISALNALESDKIQALPMVKLSFHKYLLRFKQQFD
jgi:thiamine kinase-like enzyme